MRVTIAGINAAPEPTGIAPYTSGLARGLARSGDEVRLVTGYPHYPQWQIQPGYRGLTIRERTDGVHVTRVRHTVPASPRLLNRLLMEVTFGLRAAFSNWGRPEALVVVSPALFSSAIAVARARLTGVPTYVWIQDIYSLGISETGRGGGAAAAFLKRVERWTIRGGKGVVVIHERFKRYLVDELGIDADSITVVRNWTHISASPRRDRSEVRAERGWSHDEVVVLHAGNMGAKQGLENVVAASHLAAKAHSRVRFVMLGDGNQRERLVSLGGNDRLEYLAPLPDDDFLDTLAAADVLLVNERPGLTEMCVPSKLTSYFSTGLPVIAATDATSITSEELALSGAGIRVDAGDPQALLDAAEQLASDPAGGERFGRSGLEFTSRHLAAESAIRRFASLLHGDASERILDDLTGVGDENPPR